MFQRLNPADYFTLMMDHEIRRSGLVGNFCGFALELKGIPDTAEIERRCQDLSDRFPEAVARLQRQGRRYAWNLTTNESIPFEVFETKILQNGTSNRDGIISTILNRGFDLSEAPPVEIYLVRDVDDSLLVLRWFHPAFDAKGTELLLYHLFAENIPQPPAPESAIDELLSRPVFV